MNHADENNKIAEPKTWIPEGARLNFSNKESEPIKTEYENRRKVLDRDCVQKVTIKKHP